jgi:hypothetical protein
MHIVLIAALPSGSPILAPVPNGVGPSAGGIGIIGPERVHFLEGHAEAVRCCHATHILRVISGQTVRARHLVPSNVPEHLCNHASRCVGLFSYVLDGLIDLAYGVINVLEGIVYPLGYVFDCVSHVLHNLFAHTPYHAALLLALGAVVLLLSVDVLLKPNDEFENLLRNLDSAHIFENN